MKKSLLFVMGVLFMFGFVSGAGVVINWIDPLNYPKPQPIDVSLPDEATANKYYVDVNAQAGGDGLSEATAWQHLNDANGKITAPAYIYVKAGIYTPLALTNIYGSPGKEIVIKAFGNGVASFRATALTNNYMTGANAHHIILDGGEDLELEFVTHDDPRYGLTIRSSFITVWRSRFRAGSYNGPLVDAGSFVTVEEIHFINNEFYDADNVQGAQQNMYWGAGYPSWIKSGSIRNNIFRDMGGEAIEFNPRDGNPNGYDLENMVVEGNVFHNIGKQTCFGGWRCRPAIVISGHDGGTDGNISIKNNLIWDTGSGGIWARNVDTSVEIFHNTIFNYDEYTDLSGRLDYEGITTWNNGGIAVIKNNIIYDPEGTAPFDNSAFVKSNNICDYGSCDVDWQAGTFLSVDENSPDFLKLSPTSPAIDTGADLTGIVNDDYFGTLRPQDGDNDGTAEFDIGAYEYLAVPTLPINVTSFSIMDNINSLELPEDGVKLDLVNLTLLQGEYEPFTFSIFCKVGCANLAVNMTKLINSNTDEIDSKDIEIHFLQMGNPYSSVNDWMLTPFNYANVGIGNSIRIWVTVHVPNSTPLGDYTGNLIITPDFDVPTVIPVNLKVLGQNHEDPSDVNFAVLYTISPFGQSYNPANYNQKAGDVLNFYKEFRAHGMTSVSPKTNDWKYPQGYDGTIEGFKAEIGLAVQAGLTGPILWYMSALVNGAKGGINYPNYDGKADNWNETRDLANLDEIVDLANTESASQNWPEIAYITVDEAGTHTEDQEINDLRIYILNKTMKRIASLGALGATTITEFVDDKHNLYSFTKNYYYGYDKAQAQWANKGIEKYCPHYDTISEYCQEYEADHLREQWKEISPNTPIKIYGYGHPEGITSLYNEKADAKLSGHKVWVYYNEATMKTNRNLSRKYFGIWGWKTGIDGVSSWTYPGGRTVQWEIVREGIDDFKYLKLIESLSNDSSLDVQVKNNAEAFLKNVNDSFILDGNGYAMSWNTGIDQISFRSGALDVIQQIIDSKSCTSQVHPADLDCDDTIDITELMTYINQWKNNEVGVTISTLFDALVIWKG